MVAMAIQSGRKHGIDVGAMFADVLRRHKVKQENAAAVMGQSAKQLSCGIAGTQPIDLWKVPELEWDPFMEFMGDLIRAKAASDAQRERTERLRMARAELRPREERKVAG